MVRINLLPVRTSKKKETARQQMAILLVSVLVVLGVGLGLFGYAQAKIKTAKSDISGAESELQRLKGKIGELENIKKLKDDVTKKLDVLAQLRKEKTGPVRRLATLSDATPEKLWLTKYSENGPNVSIGGIAVDEDLIAAFMRNLQQTDDYTNVELVVSEQTEVGGVKAKRFELTCAIKALKKEEPAPAKKK
ncbi:MULTISPECIES: PilN domain-containing protein [Geobacter]|mgnify:CR=1 FL=1|uniref:Fimbrial protein n=2 Tax=Geobacter TaxID=28231 RepID=A0A0C1QMU8_9BACT|nr:MULTISPECIES: PilN domain-containing protein [Geobacter]ANA40054.1 fimbrial protein [Geobacter anodireducens]KIE41937.1 fimbrial protein [Geobacter soli]MBE2886816.1 PilN domain-containing protein [Geobacter anodireducens]HMN03978.1 PilN domain-containing protein [Geobacter anodireducens]